MQKINYFELLEEISVLWSRSVFLATCNTRTLLQKALNENIEIQEEYSNRRTDEALCDIFEEYNV